MLAPLSNLSPTEQWIFIAYFLFQLWIARYWRRRSKYWMNSSTHWRRMFHKEKYGVAYTMPANYNTEKNPDKIHFDPEVW